LHLVGFLQPTNDQNSCKNALTKTTLHVGIKLTPQDELRKCSLKAPATMVTRSASVKRMAMKCQGETPCPGFMFFRFHTP